MYVLIIFLAITAVVMGEYHQLPVLLSLACLYFLLDFYGDSENNQAQADIQPERAGIQPIELLINPHQEIAGIQPQEEHVDVNQGALPDYQHHEPEQIPDRQEGTEDTRQAEIQPEIAGIQSPGQQIDVNQGALPNRQHNEPEQIPDRQEGTEDIPQQAELHPEIAGIQSPGQQIDVIQGALPDTQQNEPEQIPDRQEGTEDIPQGGIHVTRLDLVRIRFLHNYCNYFERRLGVERVLFTPVERAPSPNIQGLRADSSTNHQPSALIRRSNSTRDNSQPTTSQLTSVGTQTHEQPVTLSETSQTPETNPEMVATPNHGTVKIPMKDLRQLQDQVREAEWRQLCLACTIERKRIVFKPCGHYAVCCSCAQRIRNINGKCLLCKRVIEEYMYVYE